MNPRYLANPFFLYRHRRTIRQYLIDRVFETIAGWGLLLTANDREVAAFRNRHRGQRAFVLGNGPSLRIRDLEALKNELTFASNKIYLAFEDTSWRPSYYTVEDVLVAENNAEQISRLRLQKFFSGLVRPYFPNSSDIHYLRPRRNPFRQGRRSHRFSTNVLTGVYGGATVIFLQLQLAYFMGIREIFVLGVDFDFQVPKATVERSLSGQVIVSSGELNHFHPDYRKPGEKWTVPLLDEQVRAFKIARETFKAAGGSIVNASRKTKLEVFPRVQFEEIVASSPGVQTP